MCLDYYGVTCDFLVHLICSVLVQVGCHRHHGFHIRHVRDDTLQSAALSEHLYHT